MEENVLIIQAIKHFNNQIKCWAGLQGRGLGFIEKTLSYFNGLIIWP